MKPKLTNSINRKMVEAALIMKQINGQKIQEIPSKVDLKHVYCANFTNNVIKTIDQSLFCGDLNGGSGGELSSHSGSIPKFNSISSSTALAVSSFAPWKPSISALVIDTGIKCFTGFTNLEFEHIAKNGIPKTAVYPNLDVWIEYESGVLAIECKLCEFLAGKIDKKVGFSHQYEDLVEKKGLQGSPWIEAMKHVVNLKGECKYDYFNAVQIIKHYFGLIHSVEKEKHLLYLYWHPENEGWEAIHPFDKHAQELNDFASIVENASDVQFHHMSFNELWNQWALIDDQDVKKHVNWLEQKYLVSIKENP